MCSLAKYMQMAVRKVLLMFLCTDNQNHEVELFSLSLSTTCSSFSNEGDDGARERDTG